MNLKNAYRFLVVVALLGSLFGFGKGAYRLTEHSWSRGFLDLFLGLVLVGIAFFSALMAEQCKEWGW